MWVEVSFLILSWSCDLKKMGVHLPSFGLNKDILDAKIYIQKIKNKTEK